MSAPHLYPSNTSPENISFSPYIRVLLGNCLEFYDYIIFGLFSATIGSLCFPGDPRNSLIAALMTFAVTFVMRPIGGVIFGTIGDAVGRRVSLLWTIGGMAASTLSLSLLPSFATIGWLSPALLILCRCIQGLCIGGESMGNALVMVESTVSAKGFRGALAAASCVVGALLATVMSVVITQYLPAEQAWRAACALGGIGSAAVWYWRQSLPESLEYARASDKSALRSWRALIQAYAYRATATFLAAGVATSIFYTLLVYFPLYWSQQYGWSRLDSLPYILLIDGVMIAGMIAGGMMADRDTVEPMMVRATNGLLLCIPLGFALLAQEQTLLRLVGLTAIAGSYGLFAGMANQWMAGLFSVFIRYRMMGLFYGLGAALMGGVAPMVNQWILQYWHHPSSPVIYLMAIVLCYRVVGFLPARRYEGT